MLQDWNLTPSEYGSLSPRERQFIVAHWVEQQQRAKREQPAQGSPTSAVPGSQLRGSPGGLF